MKPMTVALAALTLPLFTSITARGQGHPTPAGPHRQAAPSARPPRSWALVVNSANNFYPYEVHGQEQSELVQIVGIPLAQALKDRDGFPAQALQAHQVLRNTLGYQENRITLMLFHDDELGNTKCEPPVAFPDNDLVNGSVDEFVDILGLPLAPLPGGGTNHLYGPNGIAGTADDPQIDFQNAQVTKANLQQAIVQLGINAAPGDRVLIYLIDHGLNSVGQINGRFYFEVGLGTPDPSDDFLTADDFDTWLDNAFCSKGLAQLVILADFCESAAFVGPLMTDESCQESTRVAVSATDVQKLAWYTTDAYLLRRLPAPPAFPLFSGSMFFHPFWVAIQNGKGVQEAYDSAWNAPDNWPVPIVHVGAEQAPMLFENTMASKVEFALMTPGGAQIWYDVQWKPDSEFALAVGTQGVVDQYYPNAVGNAYQTLRLRPANMANAHLRAVAWDPYGTEALIVGNSLNNVVGNNSTVLKYNGAFSPVPPVALNQATVDLYGVAFSPPASQARDHGVRALIVGDLGTILAYDGVNNYRKIVPGGACSWTAINAPFRDVAFNPYQTYTPAPNPGAPSITTTEATIVGLGGAWKYEFRSYQYAGQPSLDYTCERVSTILQNNGYELWGVAWDPLGNDVALMCGRTVPNPFGSIRGSIVRLDPGDNLTFASDVLDETLYDVDWKPSGGPAVMCGTGGAILRHTGTAVGSYERWDPATTPAVPTNVTLWGIDYRPIGSHAIAAGAGEKMVRFQGRTSL